MKNMFSGCNNLLYLNLTNFDLINVTSIENMFEHCDSLIYLNLGELVKQNSINSDNSNILFHNIYQNISICLNLPNINDIILDRDLYPNCSDECFINKGNVLASEKKCVENCQESEYYKYDYVKEM